tara:strand:- start:2111 stop:3766 length:1656 start_codon:yes stop_codon:yes gene_type:complete
MVYNSGTGITDHIDMLDKLIEVVTSRNLTAVAINAGGTGHAIGDVIEITATGSTSTIVAQLEVTTLSGSAISGIRIYRGGAYTVDPTTTTANAQSGTSGLGSAATFDLTFSAATWSVNRRTQKAVSAAIGTAGTGYTVGDQLTVTGGVSGFFQSDAVFNVDTITGGGGTGPVGTVSVVSASEGNFEEVPANDVAVTGGTGSGCELTVTWGDPTATNSPGQVAMLQGNGLAGADDIHVILRPYSLDINFDTAYNWALAGCTAYNSALPVHQQVGVNSNQLDSGDGDLPATDVGSYLVLKNNDGTGAITWWINHTGRRITMVCKVVGASTVQYSSMHVGFLNQFGTSTEYPYPLAVIGQTNDRDRLWYESSLLTGGIVETIANTAGDPTGPGFVRVPAGTWLGFSAENSSSGSNRTVETEFGVYPFMNPVAVGGVNGTVGSTSDVGWSIGGHTIIPPNGVPGSQTLLLKPTEGTGDPYYWLVAPFVMRQENSGANLFPDFHNLFGEIDGVFWFHTGGNAVVSEDRFVLGTRRYTIFQNGNRTQNWSYFALDED